MARYQNTCSETGSRVTVCDFKVFGANTWTVPTGITCATFEIWGAGGGGGATCCCDCYHVGIGGAGGGYSMVAIPTTPGTAYAICVGAGGMVGTTGTGTLHWCCQGGTGGTTYITGTGLTNFCAVGGTAGVSECYYPCGCNFAGGFAYGGNTNVMGSSSYGWGNPSSYCNKTFAGGSAFHQGQISGYDNCTPCPYGYPGWNTGTGGGGARQSNCCTCWQAGTGSNGLVRIKF